MIKNILYKYKILFHLYKAMHYAPYAKTIIMRIDQWLHAKSSLIFNIPEMACLDKKSLKVDFINNGQLYSPILSRLAINEVSNVPILNVASELSY